MPERKTQDRRIKFTDLSIKHLKPQEKSIEYFDEDRKSGEGAFGIRVSPRDKKVWFAMYKTQGGKIKRFSLGEYPDMRLAEARKKCNTAIAENQSGNDLQTELQRRKAAPTMNDLWRAYQESQSVRREQKSAKWATEERSRWENIISPQIGQMKVEDVSPAHLAEILREKARIAPVSANRLHGFLRQLFKPALANGWISTHPMQWIDKPGGNEPSRRRVLTDDEIRKLWPTFERVSRNASDALKIGLYTAQRPGEILSMKWQDVDFTIEVWSQETNKTGVPHLVPLSKQVTTILRERKDWLKQRSGTRHREDLKDNPWVFPSRYNTTRVGATDDRRFKGTKDVRRKLQELSGVIGWTSHDLRRTARTIMSRLEISHQIRERCLNHSIGGIAEVYDRHDYLQEKRDALQKLADEIDHIRNVNEASNQSQ
jgi:integrase